LQLEARQIHSKTEVRAATECLDRLGLALDRKAVRLIERFRVPIGCGQQTQVGHVDIGRTAQQRRTFNRVHLGERNGPSKRNISSTAGRSSPSRSDRSSAI